MQFWQLRNWLKNICDTSVYYIERYSKYSCSVKTLSECLSKDLNDKMDKKVYVKTHLCSS